MKKNLFRVFSVLLVVLMIFSVLAGCNKDKSNDSDSTKQTTAANNTSASDAVDDAITEISLPIVDTPLTLTYWVRSENIVNIASNYNDILAYQELEKRTGIHVDFLHATAGSEQEQFNLMTASRDLPDIIEVAWAERFQGGYEKAANDNIILPLNDYINKYAPNLKKLIESNPEIDKQIKTDSGNIYGFPWLQMEKTAGIYFGPIIRTDWLEKLNLPEPQTIEEWDTTLRAFVANDMNENGKADEIGLSFEALWNFDYGAPFISAWDINNTFYNDNGTVKYGYIEPECKEFFKLMNAWYEDGIMDKDFANHTWEAYEAKITSGQVGSWLGWGSDLTSYPPIMQEVYPEAEIMPLSNPGLVAGQQINHGQCDNVVTNFAAAITTVNKNVVESVKWLDYKYSEEGNLLMNFGVEGQTYEMVDGNPRYTDLIRNNPEGRTMRNALELHCAVGPGPYMSDPRYVAEMREGNVAALASAERWGSNTFSKNMPPISSTPEEADEISTIMNEVNTYAEEMFLRFIIGEEPIDNFDAFVEQLKQMNIDKAIELKQAALDRYIKR